MKYFFNENLQEKCSPSPKLCIELHLLYATIWNSWAISNPKRWCCESAALKMPANLENSAVATGLEKVCFHSNPKEREGQRISNYCTIALISHASKVMPRILQARLQWYVNNEVPDVQAGFRKGRGTRDQIANIRWIMEKAREFQKNIYFCFIDYAKTFDCVDHNRLENSERDGNIRLLDLPPEKSVCRSKSNS